MRHSMAIVSQFANMSSEINDAGLDNPNSGMVMTATGMPQSRVSIYASVYSASMISGEAGQRTNDTGRVCLNSSRPPNTTWNTSNIQRLSSGVMVASCTCFEKFWKMAFQYATVSPGECPTHP